MSKQVAQGETMGETKAGGEVLATAPPAPPSTPLLSWGSGRSLVWVTVCGDIVLRARGGGDSPLLR